MLTILAEKMAGFSPVGRTILAGGFSASAAGWVDAEISDGRKGPTPGSSRAEAEVAFSLNTYRTS